MIEGHLSVLKELHNLVKIKGVRLYLVGGYIRDMLLGVQREPLNLDFAIKSDSVQLAKYASRRIGGKFILLDERFGSARVVLLDNDRRIELDFTDFKGRTIKEDLSRRDFTINSMAVDLENIADYTDCKGRLHRLKQGLIDPTNGLKDLKKRLIRTAYKDAFREDPLRILRGFSIASRLRGFKIHPDTKILMKRYSHTLNTVSGERVLEELSKTLSGDSAGDYLKELDSLGASEAIFPEIKSMKDVEQGGYHHLDVWMHSVETVRCLELFLRKSKLLSMALKVCIKNYIDEPLGGMRKRLWIIKLAALFHDIGKPHAKYIDKDGLIWFTGHERIGYSMAKELSYRLKLSKRERDSLKALILYHLRPGYLAREAVPTRRAIFRFFRDSKEDAPGVLLLWAGDRLAAQGIESKKEDLKRQMKFIVHLLKEYFLKPESTMKAQRLLNGNEVMALLNIKEGPLVGLILQRLQEAQAEKLVSAKDEAIEWIKKIYKQGTG